MAGHSKFKNIMYRKGAQDRKKAALFARLSREIIVAVREGGELTDNNYRLRIAIAEAKSNSMPKANIDRAIKSGMGVAGPEDVFEEVRYEGYGPASVALMIEAVTNNRNRTATDVRTCMSKNGGSLAETGSVAFMFDHVGRIGFPRPESEDAFLEAALEANASDVAFEKEGAVVWTDDKHLHQVLRELESLYGEAKSAKVVWRPKNTVYIEEEKQAQTFLSLLDALEELEDVKAVFTNGKTSP